MKKPDLTKPTKEQLHEAYELALDVWSRALWERMDERQVLAVRFADGRERFMSVMGEQGEHRAIAVYPSFATFAVMEGMYGDDQEAVMDAFFSTHQLQFAFEPANHLFEGEMAQIRESGVKFKRGMNPSFVSYFAGLAPDRMGGEELKDAVASIRALLAFIDAHGPDAITLKDTPMKLLTTWTARADGSWIKGEDEFSHLFPVAITTNEDLLRKVAALPIKKNFHLEIAAFAVPMGRTPQGRGKMSRLVLAVESNTQFTMNNKLLESPDDHEFDWSPAVELALETMLKFGARPARLAAFGTALRGALQGLVATRLKGIEFMPFDSCDAAHKVFSFFRERLF